MRAIAWCGSLPVYRTGEEEREKKRELCPCRKKGGERGRGFGIVLLSLINTLPHHPPPFPLPTLYKNLPSLAASRGLCKGNLNAITNHPTHSFALSRKPLGGSTGKTPRDILGRIRSALCSAFSYHERKWIKGIPWARLHSRQLMTQDDLVGWSKVLTV